MASCKDCLHIEVCKEYHKMFWGSKSLVDSKIDETEPENCLYFKDRSRFVELPCKVGDTVYSIARISGKEEIIQDSVESFTISSFVDNTPIILFDGIETCDWDSSDFGKQVFLTKEQAEQALKERENNGKC